MRKEAVRRGTQQDETKPGPVLKETLPPFAIADPAPRLPAKRAAQETVPTLGSFWMGGTGFHASDAYFLSTELKCFLLILKGLVWLRFLH